MGNPNSKNHHSVNDDYVTVKNYNGETKDGKRHGQGVYFYPNGDVYDGEWRKSKKYGRGVYTYSDGHRLEGYFYKDQYIGKKPNEKIKKRMAKKQKECGKTDNVSVTEQTEVSTDCVIDDHEDPRFRLKTEGSGQRRAESFRRNKWLRDKYKINGGTDTLDSAQSRARTNDDDFAQTTKNMTRSFSFGGKRHKARVDLSEAEERRESKKLRESIRQKYNLKSWERKECLLNHE